MSDFLVVTGYVLVAAVWTLLWVFVGYAHGYDSGVEAGENMRCQARKNNSGPPHIRRTIDTD